MMVCRWFARESLVLWDGALFLFALQQIKKYR